MKRTVPGLDGPVEILEPKAHCPVCRQAFFALRIDNGFDSRDRTQRMATATIQLVAEVRYFQRTELTLREVLGHTLSAKMIECLARQVGLELIEAISASGEQKVIVAEVTVVP